MTGRSKKVSVLLELITYQTALEKQEMCLRTANRFAISNKDIQVEICRIENEKSQTARKLRAMANRLHVRLIK